MSSGLRHLFLALAVLSVACGSSTAPKAHDVTGFWSGTTTYSSDAACSVTVCFYNSRMMLVQTGTSVSGWYRARNAIPTDETPLVGTVQGDTLSVLINSGQVSFVGAIKFRILSDGASLEATNNGNTLRFTLEK